MGDVLGVEPVGVNGVLGCSAGFACLDLVVGGQARDGLSADTSLVGDLGKAQPAECVLLDEGLAWVGLFGAAVGVEVGGGRWGWVAGEEVAGGVEVCAGIFGGVAEEQPLLDAAVQSVEIDVVGILARQT